MLSLRLTCICLGAAFADYDGVDLAFPFEKEKIIHGPYITTYWIMSYDPALFRVTAI